MVRVTVSVSSLGVDQGERIAHLQAVEGGQLVADEADRLGGGLVKHFAVGHLAGAGHKSGHGAVAGIPHQGEIPLRPHSLQGEAPAFAAVRQIRGLLGLRVAAAIRRAGGVHRLQAFPRVQGGGERIGEILYILGFGVGLHLLQGEGLHAAESVLHVAALLLDLLHHGLAVEGNLAGDGQVFQPAFPGRGGGLPDGERETAGHGDDQDDQADEDVAALGAQQVAQGVFDNVQANASLAVLFLLIVGRPCVGFVCGGCASDENKKSPAGQGGLVPKGNRNA